MSKVDGTPQTILICGYHGTFQSATIFIHVENRRNRLNRPDSIGFGRIQVLKLLSQLRCESLQPGHSVTAGTVTTRGQRTALRSAEISGAETVRPTVVTFGSLAACLGGREFHDVSWINMIPMLYHDI